MEREWLVLPDGTYRALSHDDALLIELLANLHDAIDAREQLQHAIEVSQTVTRAVRAQRRARELGLRVIRFHSTRD